MHFGLAFPEPFRFFAFVPDRLACASRRLSVGSNNISRGQPCKGSVSSQSTTPSASLGQLLANFPCMPPVVATAPAAPGLPKLPFPSPDNKNPWTTVMFIKTYTSMSVWTHGCLDICIDGWMHGWMDLHDGSSSVCIHTYRHTYIHTYKNGGWLSSKCLFPKFVLLRL